MPKAVNHSGLYDKHNCPQRDSIPGPRALQSDMLPLDHCDLQSFQQRQLNVGRKWSVVYRALQSLLSENMHCQKRDKVVLFSLVTGGVPGGENL